MEVVSAKARFGPAVLAAILLGTSPCAQARTGATPQPVAPAPTPAPAPAGPDSLLPRASGVVRASDWLEGSPAAEDSAEAARDSLRRRQDGPADTMRAPEVFFRAGSLPSGGAATDRSPAATVPDSANQASSGDAGERPSASDRFYRLPPNTATGVSAGYPSYPGFFVVAPADGRLAFRSGLTGFPTIGILLTPGMEYRFGHQPGTLSQNAFYAFGNAFLGRSYLSRERDYLGMELGLGYRWLVDDRRGVRWIAALEAGGYFGRVTERDEQVSRQRHPCLRFIWLLVE